MIIAICFDKNFQKWATVCLYSIWEQHKNSPKIRLVILSDINYRQAIWQLKKVLKHFDFTFDNPGNDFDSMPTGYHFNVTTYWRLALPKVLANYGIKKAIYLDTDTLIVENLQELFDVDLNGKTCGGSLDIGSLKHIERMSLKQGFAINGGVLLMDVAKMNQFNWADEANRLNQQGLIQWVDQDVINILLDCEIALLDLKWNKQTGHFLHKYPEKPAIVHFTMWADKKPWFTTFRHPYIPKLLEILLKNGFLMLYTKIFWNYFKNLFIKKTSSFAKKYFRVQI